MNRRVLGAFACLLVACSGASKDPGVDELNDGDDTGGASDSTAGGDDTDPGGDDAGSSFDVNGDTNVGDIIDPDASCAKTQAEAIKPPVDIIFAIDQSGSMSTEIAQVKANINKLSGFLGMTGLDYRVVMIASKGTSSSYTVCVPPPLGMGPPTCGSTAQLRVVDRNVQSTDALSIVLSTYDAAPGTTLAWADFLRPAALKVFVPVTDDQSTVPAATFDTQIMAKPGGQFGTAAKRNYTFYPIIGSQKYPSEVKCPTGVNNGPQYIALAKLTKGKWFSVCDADYGPVFSEMAKDIVSTLACDLTIPPPPMGETLDPNKVNVNYTPTGGAEEPILKDDSKPCDAGANGWQYSADKTKVLLCGDACAKVKAGSGKVNVAFGCATVVKPPS